MVKKITFGLFAVLFNLAIINGQINSKSKIDSLNSWIENHFDSINDTSELYNNAIWSLALSKKENSKTYTLKGYKNLGKYHEYHGQLDSAIYFLIKTKEIYHSLADTNSLAETFLELESLYNAKADYSSSMKQVFSALELYEGIDNQKGVAICYAHLSDLLYYEFKYQESVEYCDKAIAIQIQIGALKDLALSYRYKASSLLFIDGKLDLALETINKAIAIYTNEGEDGMPLLASLNGRGNILKYMGRYEQAIADYRNVYEKSVEMGLERYAIPTLANIGHVYVLQEKYKEALPYNLEAIDLMIASGNTKNLSENYMLVSESYYNLGDFQNAYIYHKLYTDEYIKFLSGIIDRLESEAKIKYETAKKDETITVQENTIENQRKVQILYFSIALLLILSLIGMYRSRKNIGKKRVELEKSKEELQHSLETLKATQAQLIQAEKMASLGELTAGIAHEIQNPLNFVNNFSEISVDLIDEMKEELVKGNSDEIKSIANDLNQNLNKINHHGKRASNIVKGMLEHSRTNAGEKEPVDINTMADEYLRLAYHGLRAKDKSFNAEFQLELDENLPKANVVSQDIGRVLLNLINNAFYACILRSRETTFSNITDSDDRYKPTVTVSTKKLEDKIEIKIKDNGNGIPKKIRDKIFQPFFTTKPTGEGTGLGLSLSYDIISQGHNGEIKVKTDENTGTEFIIQLPIQSNK